MFIICILFDNAIIFTKSLEFVKDFKKDKKLAFAMNTCFYNLILIYYFIDMDMLQLFVFSSFSITNHPSHILKLRR